NRFLSLEVNHLGIIYEDRKLIMAVREQNPFVIGYPNCDAAKCIKNIAEKIIGEKKQSVGIGAQGLFKKFFNIFS
ncbi:MinD/ParA family ATP-binding protein, partial [Clostridium perfringens]|nr:MinD/ParA family protein [Clostridium perfringens]